MSDFATTSKIGCSGATSKGSQVTKFLLWAQADFVCRLWSADLCSLWTYTSDASAQAIMPDSIAGPLASRPLASRH